MGLLRVREFMMAEIEYFIDPLETKHKRFNEVADLKMNLLTKHVQ
jgi:glycyl-tRNA synthetase